MSRELSLEYLLKFLEFAKEKLYYDPIVLGGWAVYALTKKEMSVDVDLLLKSRKDVGLVKPFFDKCGFKLELDKNENVTFEKTLEKPIEIDNIKMEYFIFDIIIKDEPNKLHEDKNVDVSWDLCFEYNKKIKYEGLEFVIPIPELLLIYKVKAYRDRNYDKHSMIDHFAGKKAWHARKDFKINKDKRDILNLINNQRINSNILDEILAKTSFKDYFNETIDAIVGSNK